MLFVPSRRVLCLALSLALTQAAIAGDDPQTSPKQERQDTVALDAVNVVYSATRTVTPVVELPQSVSVVTPDRIHTYGMQGLDETVRYMAGVVGGSYGPDPRSDWIRVRGYDPARYLDGLPLVNGDWTGGSRIEVYGLERIEVDKGPSSAMYGQLPPGGMINMTSKRPSLDAPREVEATVGSFDERQLATDLGGQLDKDAHWLWRVVGVARNGDSNIKHSQDDRYYFAPSLSWLPDDDTSFTLLGRFQRTNSDGVGGFLPMDGTLHPNPNGKIPSDTNPGEPDYDYYRKLDRSIGWEFTHRFDDVWSVRQDVRVQNAEVKHAAIGSLGFEPGSDRIISRYNFPLEDESHVFAINNQAEAKFGSGSDVEQTVLMGLDYQRSHNNYRSGFGSAPSLDIYDPVYGAPIPETPVSTHTDRTLRQFGAYVQDQIDIGKWGIVASGRKDWVTNNISDRIADTWRTQKDNAFSGRLGVNYRTDSGIVPYLAYSHSFQTTVGQSFDGKTFEPTKGDQYEAGAKYQSPDQHTLITAAVYQLTQRNALTVDPDHLFFSVQQGKTRTRGAELEANVAVTDSFSMTAAYAYTHAEVVEANDDSKGKLVALIPRRQASLSGDYGFHEGALAGFGVGAGARYIGAHYGDAANEFRTGGYVTYDLNAHYEMDRWRFQVTAANLTDHEYITACNNTMWCYYGYPRVVTASVRYRW